MTVAALDLRCPTCGEHLTDIGNAYRCERGHEWPVVEGIPRFVERPSGGAAQIQDVFDFEHRRYEDSSYTRFGPQLVQQFLDDCRLPAEFFDGKQVLDAGCGSGRWTYALSELGADVTAIDLTAGGIESAEAEMRERRNVRFLQADLFNLPFAPESFDFVLSWGVLHHTPGTRRAFDSLTPLVRRGGVLYVMVYERYSRLRMLGTNTLRFAMRRLSHERRYAFMRHLIVPNTRLGALAHKLMLVSFRDSGLDEQTMKFGLYDAYSPRYNHVHTTEEVEGWFADSGFDEIVAVAPPGLGNVRVRGRRR